MGAVAACCRFPRAAPAGSILAVRPHHVCVLAAHLGGDTPTLDRGLCDRQSEGRLMVLLGAGAVLLDGWIGS
jgi:hypothetical protein